MVGFKVNSLKVKASDSILLVKSVALGVFIFILLLVLCGRGL